MMGHHEAQKDLFSYHIDLNRRVPADHPLREIARRIDFSFVRAEVEKFYGTKGNVSVDPVVILKLMFLLFYDNVPSERELMKGLAFRLDYLWFLGYSLDDPIPDHSVLSKARKRWGKEVFEGFFVRTVMQCLQAELIEGSRIHVDSSLVDANASKDSVKKGDPELIAALKQAYQAQESKLEDRPPRGDYQRVNDRLMSTTDPDAAVAARRGDSSRPRYHHHRVVDDAQGVITAVETTPGSIPENQKLVEVVQQHERNTRLRTNAVVADHKYGTAENYIAGQQKGWTTHMGDLLAKRPPHRCKGIFPESAFTYRAADDVYICPAGQVMKPGPVRLDRRTRQYILPKQICAACSLRARCTRAVRYGRTILRHEHQELLDRARVQAHSAQAQQDRKRRHVVMEQSFADAANNHGFKRSRWRRLWRQQIQDYLIAAIQNIRTLLRRAGKNALGTGPAPENGSIETVLMVFSLLRPCVLPIARRLAT